MEIEPFLQSLQSVSINTPSAGAIVSAVLILLLLVLSGFASCSEIAFFSLSPQDIDQLDGERNETDKHILEMLDDSERTLATILVTNNFVNVTIIMLCNYLFGQLIDFGGSEVLQFLFTTVLLTFVLLLFGEIVPKVYGTQHTLRFCRMAVRPLRLFRTLFRPLCSLLMTSGILTDKLIRHENHALTVDDLEQALELTDKEDLKDEQKLLQGIIRFGDETAKEIMTSRQDVVDLDFRSTMPDVIRCIVENNYSRIPVYQDNTDNIRGILYIKDLLPHLQKPSTFRWQTLIRPPYFVPETKKIDDLLKDFQENKVHIAIVVDEFGGTSGIVTLEDILEEIVGEINDEYDEEEKTYTRINKNTYMFEGKTLLSDFYKILSLPDDTFEEVEGDADSLAGLLLEIKGEFPELHERIEYGNFCFEVMEKEERRLSKVKVILKKT